MALTSYYLSKYARRVLICRNPWAGARDRRRLLEALKDELLRQGLEVSEHADVAELAELAQTALAADQLRAVVAAGGDGTAALLAQRTSPGTPLAVFPLGTENLLSKHLGQSADPEAAAARIARGAVVRLDAGSANGHLFVLMVGCGFDAHVVHRLHADRRGHIRHLSYAKPILSAIRSYQYPELRIYCEPDEENLEKIAPERVPPWHARWAFVVNLPRYAGGLRFIPHADGCDGLLDVCTFRRGSLFHGLRYLLGVVSGRHLRWSDFRTRRVRRLRIESDSAIPYQLDGDPGGFLPLEIEVLPQRLTLVADPAWVQLQGGVVLEEAERRTGS
jgi:diacylglycerol kinase family enzyme